MIIGEKNERKHSHIRQKEVLSKVLISLSLTFFWFNKLKKNQIMIKKRGKKVNIYDEIDLQYSLTTKNIILLQKKTEMKQNFK